MKGVCALVLIVLLTACPGDQIDRVEWNEMTPQARVLYVKALLGEEKSKEAKGGNDRLFAGPAETYVARIDAAYAKGDTRPADQIFAEMGSSR